MPKPTGGDVLWGLPLKLPDIKALIHYSYSLWLMPTDQLLFKNSNVMVVERYITASEVGII